MKNQRIGICWRSLRTPTLLLLVAILSALGASAQQTITGSAGGALYEFIVPQPWNGQLIVYAHGAVDPAAPIALPNTPLELQLFQAITSQGFALAASSYSQNGWAVKEGIQNTDQLRELFSDRVGKPTRTYLVGVSMGGLINLDLAEKELAEKEAEKKFAPKYDGALSVCGVVGGTGVLFQRGGDARVLFDYFFPGVLPGDLLHNPNFEYSQGSFYWNSVTAALVAGLQAPGQPTLQFANVAGLTGATVGEIIFSGINAAGANFNELLGRTHGHNFYDNTRTVYKGSANDAALNTGVRRFRADTEGLEYIERYYQPTGELRIPLVSIHTTRDQTVDFSEEAVYAALVAKGGDDDDKRKSGAKSSLLVQQSVNRYGHCNFKPQEILGAFQGLFGWVNYQIKPAGGDVTIP